MSNLVPGVQQINTNMNVPTPQGFLQGALKSLSGAIGIGVRGLNLGTVLDKNADPRDRGIAAGGVINPWLGTALSGMAAFDDKMTEWTGVSSQGPGAGRGEGYRAFSAVKPSDPPATPQPTSTMTENSDGSRRSSDGGTVYSADGKRYTTNGVTYEVATGQAV